jgi:hypothetical protein
MTIDGLHQNIWHLYETTPIDNGYSFEVIVPQLDFD